MARSYDPLNDPSVRKEARPDGSYALFGPGNKFLGNAAGPMSPEEAGAMQGRQDSAYIAARDGAPLTPASAMSAPRYPMATSLGPSSIADNGYGTPINRESAGLSVAGADGKTPYGRSMDNVAKGDLSGFRGQRTPTPRDVFAGQSLNGGSGKTYGVDGGSVTFNGGGLPKGFSGYATPDGKYKTIGPNGEVGIHENEQAAIASFGAQPAVPTPAPTTATPAAGYEQRPVESFTSTQQEVMQQPNGSSAGRGFGVVNAAAPTAAPLPSYADVLAPAAKAATSTPQNPTGVRGQPTNPTPTYGLETMFSGPGPETVKVRSDPAQAIRVPGQGRSTNTGQPLARPQPAQVMAYNAPGNPVSAAAPQDLSQSPISRAPAEVSPITAAPEPVSPIMPAMQADALRTTSPTAQLNTAMKKRPQQVAANVFTRPRNFSMRGNLMPA